MELNIEKIKEKIVTLPYERHRAVVETEKFLLELLDPKKTPRVPKNIREQARWCLRHYPSRFEMELTSEKYPEMWSKDYP